MERLGEVTFSIGSDQLTVALQAAGASNIARLARKFGAPASRCHELVEVAQSLEQVRQVLQLVDGALVMQEALGHEPLIQPGTVRNELVLLSRAIAKLNGVGERPAQILR